MAKYIDADLLHIKMEDLYEHHIEMRNYSADGAVADCLDLLENTPTADVVEVKHGEWIKCQRLYGIGYEYICSVCQKGVRQYNEQPICSECGAKMDGERK